MAKNKKIIKPTQLIEKDTNYSFLKFWKDFSSEDEDWEEDDGGSLLKWGCKKNLKGLLDVCAHYTRMRHNKMGDVKLKDLTAYIAKHDDVFKQRVEEVINFLPDVNAQYWIEQIYAGNNTYRKQLGLKPIKN